MRVVIERDAAADVDSPFDGEACSRLGACLDFEPTQPRAAAVPEEEEIRIRLVALDEIVDAVVVEVGCQLRPPEGIPGGDVELQARFRIEIGIPGDEATP